MCMIVNKRTSPFDVYIGRGSEWGNPYVLGKDGNRSQVIGLFKSVLWIRIKNGEITLDALKALDGKRLGCFCKPLACHGDVIKDAVVWALTQ